MRQEGEPSVEEILDSIKRVIARDASQASQTRPRRRESLVSQSEESDCEEDEDILDLGEVGSTMQEEDADAPDASEPEPQSTEHPASSNNQPTVEEALTTTRAAEAMRQSLAALAMLSDPPAKPQIVRSGETSLEGMVREMLRPMLAQWLDANLPEMVEQLVKAEIARIAGKKS